VPGDNRTRTPLDSPLHRRQVQELLAHENLTQQEIGDRYGVTQQAVSAFAKRHAETIRQIKENAADEFAGIMLAGKKNRLEAYQHLIELALTPTPKIDNKGHHVTDTNGEHVYEVDGKLAATVLKQIAEELGQLPNRLTLAGEVGVKTNYVIDGVSPDDLK
jgi:predicted transcriptional regulator